MDELDKALDIALTGSETNRALDEFRAQIDHWGLTMPNVDPLVLDFGLGKFRDIGLIEYWIANEADAGYCGKFLFVFDGQTCPLHSHKIKMETFYLVKGSARMRYDNRENVMNPGDVLPVAPGKLHSFTGIGPALFLELSKPCRVADNYFENRQIPIGGNYDGQGKKNT